MLFGQALSQRKARGRSVEAAKRTPVLQAPPTLQPVPSGWASDAGKTGTGSRTEAQQSLQGMTRTCLAPSAKAASVFASDRNRLWLRADEVDLNCRVIFLVKF